MHVKLRHVVNITLICALLGYYIYHQYFFVPLSLPGVPEIKPDSRCPEILLPDLTGQPRDIHAWDGKVVVLNFWRLSCTVCIRELPALVQGQTEYAEKGVQFIGIVLLEGTEADEVASIKHLALTKGINYPQLLANKAQGQDLLDAFRNTAHVIPFTVVIDRQRNIASMFGGELNRRAISKLLLPFL